MTVVRIARIDHVQLAMPPGAEADAIAFYEGVLGIPHVAKPEALAARGGCWFEDGELKIHLGVEESFRAAQKAHPALVVEGLAALVDRLLEHNCAITHGDNFDGRTRIYIDDPFGNRIELIAAS